jgi:ABC-type glycerol-3-phosphate transport system permease component
MNIVLMSFLIGLAAALLFINIFFRVKVFKVYRNLVDNRVEFKAGHIFNKERMENEIIPKYPGMQTEINAFVKYIRMSLTVSAILVILTTILGAILMYAS